MPRPRSASIERIPGDPETQDVETNWLPAAYAAAGRTDEAVAVLETAARRGSSSALVALGDIRVLGGDVEGAKSLWREAADRARAEPKSESSKRTKTDALVRTVLVGKPAKDLDVKTWIGAEPRRLSAFRGKIVLLCVFETTCQQCRDGIRTVSGFRKRRPSEDLVVLGLIPRSDTAWSPTRGAADPWSEGRHRTCLDEGPYDAMVAEFRETLDLGFPVIVSNPLFVIPFMAAMEENTVVIDRDGTIAFATPGHSRVHAATAVVERLLSAK